MSISLTGLVAGLLVTASPSPTPLAVASTGSGQGSERVDRVIVFFDGTPSTTSVLNASTDETDLRYVRSISSRMRVYQSSAELSDAEVARLDTDLSALPNVSGVLPDVRVEKSALTLSDPYYSLYQHDLYGTYGINVEPAWNITKGAGVTVAVVDTGLRTSHPDLAANVVDGYDFVSPSDTYDIAAGFSSYFSANDGTGWDSDASDPGDWPETYAEVTARKASNSSAKYRCDDPSLPEPPNPSSPPADIPSNWHGTHVAGTIAAVQNNSRGISGIAPEATVVPVRVLGRCGGSLSDLLAGMRWAAGLTVPGVPENRHPAKILNLSLGAVIPSYSSYYPCKLDLATAVNDVTNAGALIVTAAGNDNANVVNSDGATFPASCANTFSVASVSDAGARSSFSNFGSAVDIAAPGEGILSASNSGTTVPSTDVFRFMQGTSMAAPHVVGVAALALSVNPYLTVTELRSVLTDHTKAFAPDPTPAPVSGDSRYPTCNMSSYCGAGIVDAGAAVTYAAANVRPGPPTNVTASRDKADVTVSWEAPSNVGSSAIIEYVVQANGNDACTSSVATDRSCKIPGMSAGTYTFTVQAVNSQGGGPVSAPSDSLVVVTAPSAVRNVSAQRAGRSITVTWDAPSVLGGLSVSYEVSGLPSGTVETAAFSYTFSSLTAGSTYTFSVTAKNSEGAASPVSADPVTIYMPPSEARSVTAVRYGQSVTVSWEPPVDSGGLPTWYSVYAGPGGTGTTASTSYTFDNMAPGITYTFWVTALNAEGASFAEPSPPVSVFAPPSTVQNATASASVGTVTISWLPPVQSGGHQVSYFITGGPEGLVSTSATSYTFSSLEIGTTYTFLIFASNPEGSSDAVRLFSTPLSPPDPTTTSTSTSTSTTTTVKPLPVLARISRGSKTSLTKIFVAPKGATTKWYASGSCFISSSRVVATRSKGTCRLTVLSALKGIKTRRTYSIKVL